MFSAKWAFFSSMHTFYVCFFSLPPAPSDIEDISARVMVECLYQMLVKSFSPKEKKKMATIGPRGALPWEKFFCVYFN